MVYGEYTLEGEMNLTPYFEVLYSTRDVHTNNGAFQLFPFVPARNPFNICNPEGQGVDCGLAEDALWLNPELPSTVHQSLRRYRQRRSRSCSTGRSALLPSRPIVSVIGRTGR